MFDGLGESSSIESVVSTILGLERKSGAEICLFFVLLFLVTDRSQELLDVAVAMLDERRFVRFDGLVVLAEGTEGVSNANEGPFVVGLFV